MGKQKFRTWKTMRQWSITNHEQADGHESNKRQMNREQHSPKDSKASYLELQFDEPTKIQAQKEEKEGHYNSTNINVSDHFDILIRLHKQIAIS